MTVLCDSNVLVDLLTDNEWADWASARMEELSAEEFAINPLIYAEVSVPYASSADLESDLSKFAFRRLELPWLAAFWAGKAHARYLERGGTRTSPLPDFYIGAHAHVSGLRLLTRDARRYRTYFPDLEVIAPD